MLSSYPTRIETDKMLRSKFCNTGILNDINDVSLVTLVTPFPEKEYIGEKRGHRYEKPFIVDDPENPCKKCSHKIIYILILSVTVLHVLHIYIKNRNYWRFSRNNHFTITALRPLRTVTRKETLMNYHKTQKPLDSFLKGYNALDLDHRPILIDVDSVLADFTGRLIARINDIAKTDYSLRRALEPITKGRESRELLREDVTSRDWFFSQSIELKIQAKLILAQPHWWTSILPFDGIKDALVELNKHRKILYVTAPWNNCPSWLFARRQWLLEHSTLGEDFEFGSALIATDAKEHNSGCCLIEDHPETLRNWLDCQGMPSNTAYLIDQSHNQSQGEDLPRYESFVDAAESIVRRLKRTK